jgi:hypothetical protein
MAMKALSKATIYQVAQLAGVSIATVSRALRDSELVTPQTRERVQQAARELQFTPSRLGRSLAEGRHAANGIVFPELVGPYYAEVVLGYEVTAATFGSSTLILATRGRPDAAAAVRDLAARVDGLTVMGQSVGDDVVAAPACRWCCWPATRSRGWTRSGPATTTPPGAWSSICSGMGTAGSRSSAIRPGRRTWRAASTGSRGLCRRRGWTSRIPYVSMVLILKRVSGRRVTFCGGRGPTR